MRLVAGFVGAAEPLLHFGARGFGGGDAVIEILDDLGAPLGPPLAHLVMVLDEIAARRGTHHVERRGRDRPWRQPVARLLPTFVVLGKRALLVGFELRLVGDGVLERPVLPHAIAVAFAALKLGQRSVLAVEAKVHAIFRLAPQVAGVGSHLMTLSDRFRE